MAIPHTTTRTVTRSGVNLAVDVAGVGPPVVLAHGFPELAFSWRHQVPALVAAGYRVAVPEQRGYGRSDRPTAIEDYDMVQLTADLLAVLDDLGEEKAVFVGHDWGAMVVWWLALMAPERVSGVVGMSVPFLPRGPVPTITLLRQIFGNSHITQNAFNRIHSTGNDCDPGNFPVSIRIGQRAMRCRHAE